VSDAADQRGSARLALTRREMNRIVARRYGALCLLVAVFTVLPGAALLAGKSAGEKGFGGALIVAFVVFTAVMYGAGRREVSREFPRLPVIEATPEELRLSEPTGETFRVRRHGLASIVRLTAPGIRGSRVLFRDAGERTITHWDLGWIAPMAMRWMGQLGYQTSRISGQAAVKAAYPEDDIDGDGAGATRRRS
jgi:hypothetical protein